MRKLEILLFIKKENAVRKGKETTFGQTCSKGTPEAVII